MASPNKDVSDYLAAYYAAKSPKYAIMLSGPWGSGKTWLIEDSLKNANPPVEHVYISLYGISKSTQIDEEIFRKLHPVLGSKGSQLAARAIKSIFRLGLKIDLDGDHKDDVTVNAQAPDIDLPKFLRNTKQHIIVFDDLERSTMPIVDLLGYINQFVEHQDNKVVLVANEKELKTKGIEGEYGAIKEKLVGRTLCVTSDARDALPTFIEEMSSPSARSVVDANIGTVIALFGASSFNNLRHLRHGLLEFDRMMTAMTPRHKECHEIPSDLLAVLLALSFEYRNGSLRSEQVTELNAWAVAAAKRNGQPDAQTAASFFAKYSTHLPSDWLLSLECWQRILGTGLYNPTEINQQLDLCHYYNNENTPEWVQLWRFFELSDERVTQLCESRLPRFLESSLTDIEETTHLLGIFLTLQSLAVISTPRTELLRAATTTIDRLEAAGALAGQEKNLRAVDGETGSRSLGFQARETPEFAEFRVHVRGSRLRHEERGFPDRAAILLQLLETDARAFRGKLVVLGGYDAEYLEIPILAHVNVDQLVAAVGRASPDVLDNLNRAIIERYRHSEFAPRLLSEQSWLRETASKLEQLASERKGRMSSVHIGNIAANMRKAVAELATIDARARDAAAARLASVLG